MDRHCPGVQILARERDEGEYPVVVSTTRLPLTRVILDNNFYVSYFQKLCELVCELLLEESNVHYVSTPVTVCGDIHGQVM